MHDGANKAGSGATCVLVREQGKVRREHKSFLCATVQMRAPVIHQTPPYPAGLDAWDGLVPAFARESRFRQRMGHVPRDARPGRGQHA
jgi:hypothetical protein